MNTLFSNILALLAIVTFIALMFFTATDKNRLFIKYMMLIFPLLRLDCVPGNFQFTTFDFLTYLFLLLFYKRKENLFFTNKIYLILFLVILSASIIGCLNAESLSEATAQDFIRLFSIFIFSKILLDECLVDSSFIHSIISWIKVSLIISLIFLACQFIFGVGFALEKELNNNVLAEVTRYTSFLSDPQKYAQFLAAVSFLLLIKRKEDAKLPLENYLLIFLSLIAILCTGARAGLGGWCVGLFIVIIFGQSRYRFVLLTSCLLLFFVVTTFKDSFATFEREQSVSESYEFRYGIWQDAFGIFLKHPYTGIGLGNYRNYVSVHNSDQFWVTENGISYYDQPESGYLKILTEIGLIGFFAVLLLILIPLCKGLVIYLKYNETFLLFLIASIVSWMVGFYTVYSFSDIRIMLLIATIICLLISSYKQIFSNAEQVN